jgi:glutamate 5-kinase
VTGVETVRSARRVVVKIGSSLLIGPDGAARKDWMGSVAADIASLKAQGCETAIVSSGAVALGRAALKLSGKLKLEEKQAAAAAGQARLMRAWEEAFEPHGVPVAQALLTPDDTERRRRWLNARATLGALLGRGAMPIINENDTVATQELRYGDNDRLAARVAQMISADALILFSDVDGLYTANPSTDPAAQRLAQVTSLTPAIMAMAGDASSPVGSGGMRTKLEAARIAGEAGCATIIAKGGGENPLAALLAGAPHTFIHASAEPRAAYKAWIAGALSPQGAVVVDAGAALALKMGKSLLPAGVTAVRGPFEKGDAVRILGPDGEEIGRGLARYDSVDADAIKGLQSEAIESVLGYAAGATLIHADDIAPAS